MKKILSILLLFSFAMFFAQTVKKDTIKSGTDKDEVEVVEDIKAANTPKNVKRLSPIKAGLYSAVLPGLGQYYNKKYWKIPIVWGAVGTGIGVTLYEQHQYKRYRDAFIAELNGQPHEFSGIKGVTATSLGNSQDSAKRYRDYAIAITGLVYILNIVDAVVDAHLYEGRHDPDLSFSPAIIQYNNGMGMAKAGLSFNFNF